MRLSWQTATEINNDYFTLERSIDGINFESIRTVDGAGNSSTPLNYTYTDNNPKNGVSYYRLIQTDYDGKYEVLNTISLSYLNEDLFEISPNPASDNLTVRIGTETSNGVLSIHDNMGKLLVNDKFNGTHISMDISIFPKGIYFVIFSDGYDFITKKVIFQ